MAIYLAKNLTYLQKILVPENCVSEGVRLVFKKLRIFWRLRNSCPEIDAKNTIQEQIIGSFQFSVCSLRAQAWVNLEPVLNFEVALWDIFSIYLWTLLLVTSALLRYYCLYNSSGILFLIYVLYCAAIDSVMYFEYAFLMYLLYFTGIASMIVQ